MIAALLAAACTPAEDATPVVEADVTAETVTEPKAAPGKIKFYAMDCGRIKMLDLSIFTRGQEYNDRQHDAADTCFLIRHPDGDLMWDAGLPDQLHEQEGGVTNGPFHVSVPVTLQSQLDKLGVELGEIEYFSISHSHFDHVGNASLFAGSTFIVDKDERSYMFSEEARKNPQIFQMIAALEEAETIEFDGDYDVFGDGTVKIMAMPGHTPGHTALLVTLDNTGPVLLAGDLYHLKEARKFRTVPDFNTSLEDTLDSMDRFEEIAKETGARVIIQHSLDDMEALPKLPEYLD